MPADRRVSRECRHEWDAGDVTCDECGILVVKKGAEDDGYEGDGDEIGSAGFRLGLIRSTGSLFAVVPDRKIDWARTHEVLEEQMSLLFGEKVG